MFTTEAKWKFFCFKNFVSLIIYIPKLKGGRPPRKLILFCTTVCFGPRPMQVQGVCRRLSGNGKSVYLAVARSGGGIVKVRNLSAAPGVFRRAFPLRCSALAVGVSGELLRYGRESPWPMAWYFSAF